MKSLPIKKRSSPTAESNAVGEAEMLSIIDFCCRDSKKSSPTVRGGYSGGVIENDFLMCEIENLAFIHSQSPHQKVEAAGVERRRRSRNTFENKYLLFRQPHNSVSTAEGRCNQERTLAFFVVRRIEFTLSRRSHKKSGSKNCRLVASEMPSEKWRRRESNPRPNSEPEGFLHVYSALNPLEWDGHRRPDPHRSL